MDGVQVASDWIDLIDGTLESPINATEYGTAPGGSGFVRTGTSADGSSEANNCANWTSASTSVGGCVGDRTSTSGWSDFALNLRCDYLYHIYCFEQ